MNIFKLAGQILLIYLLYKLIVNIIIPMYRSAKQVRGQFKQMQDMMQDQMNRTQNQHANPPPQRKEPPAQKDGDYIDFEEVK